VLGGAWWVRRRLRTIRAEEAARSNGHDTLGTVEPVEARVDGDRRSPSGRP
jgi:hypothetical protein